MDFGIVSRVKNFTILMAGRRGEMRVAILCALRIFFSWREMKLTNHLQIEKRLKAARRRRRRKEWKWFWH
jgi:hypothetical protein